jgi:hypothetical protein
MLDQKTEEAQRKQKHCRTKTNPWIPWVYPSMDFMAIPMDFTGIPTEPTNMPMKYMGIPMDSTGISTDSMGIPIESMGIPVTWVTWDPPYHKLCLPQDKQQP